MTKNLKGLLFLFLSNAVQKLATQKNNFKDITRLKFNLLYLKFIKLSRMLFLSYLGMAISLIFLLVGLILLHVTFFLYAPCTTEAKMWVGFISGFIYLGIAIKTITYVCSEERWIGLFNAKEMLKTHTSPPPENKAA